MIEAAGENANGRALAESKCDVYPDEHLVKETWFAGVDNHRSAEPIGCGGCFRLDVPLKPTAAALAKASGVANFQQGGAGAALVATLRGLGPGSYTLDVVRKSDGSVVTLGKVVVTDPTAGPDREANDDVKEPGTVEHLEVQVSVGLPPGLAPANIAQIRVKSAGGAVLLSGSLDAPRPSAPASK